MRNCKPGLILPFCLTVLLLAGTVLAGSQATYDGTVRIYVVEPESRWDDNNGDPFDFGFLDFAQVQTISVPDADTYSNSLSWDPAANGWTGVTSDNIEIIVVLFDDDYVETDAYPPYGYYFNAYYVDAACAALPGIPGRNISDAEYTHTVFLEEGTATGCQHCPLARAALKNIYDSGSYNFVYAALVVDNNTLALSRMTNDLNYPGTPSSYFDCGYEVVVGGEHPESVYQTAIETCCDRMTPDVDLVARLNWSDKGTMTINYRVGNGVPANTPPSVPEFQSGPAESSPGASCIFTICTSDADEDAVRYQVDWNDGPVGDWSNLVPHGLCYQTSHSWSTAGTYQIKVRGVDTWGDTTAWSDPRQITITESGSCCQGTSVGNLDCVAGIPDMGDLTVMIDHLFISLSPLCCVAEGDVDLSGQPDPESNPSCVDMGDLTVLIDHLFISLNPLPSCP